MTTSQSPVKTAFVEPANYFNTYLSRKHHYLSPVNKIIRLRCIHGRQPQKLILTPCIAIGTNEPLGVERLTDEMMKKRNYVVTTATKLTVTDGMEFNLADEIQRINWNWVQYCPQIAADLDEALFEHSEVYYYVEDEEKQLTKKLTNRDQQFAAQQLVRGLLPDQLYDYARLMGTDMGLHTSREVMDYMLDLAETSYAKLLSLEKDVYKSDRLLLYRLVDTRIVREENGVFYFEQIRLGVDESSALSYMLMAGNRDIVDRMKSLYYQQHRPSHGGSAPLPVRGDRAMMNPVKLPSTGPASMTGDLGLVVGQLSRLAPVTYQELFEDKSPADITFVAEALGVEYLKTAMTAEIRSKTTVPEKLKKLTTDQQDLHEANNSIGFAPNEIPLTPPTGAQFSRSGDKNAYEEEETVSAHTVSSGYDSIHVPDDGNLLDDDLPGAKNAHVSHHQTPRAVSNEQTKHVLLGYDPDTLGDPTIISTPDQIIPIIREVLTDGSGEPFATGRVAHVTSSGPLTSDQSSTTTTSERPVVRRGRKPNS